MTDNAAVCRRARLSEPQRQLLVALCTDRRVDRASPEPQPNGPRRTLAALRQKSLVRPVPGAASDGDVEPTEAAFALLDLGPRAPDQADDARRVAVSRGAAKRPARRTPKLAHDGERQTKVGTLLALLRRSEGASLAEMQAAVGWQAHSVRGFLSGTVRKKLGAKLNGTVGEDGVRRYRVEAEQADGS